MSTTQLSFNISMLGPPASWSAALPWNIELSLQYPGDNSPCSSTWTPEARSCTVQTLVLRCQDVQALFKALSVSENRICTTVNGIVKFVRICCLLTYWKVEMIQSRLYNCLHKSPPRCRPDFRHSVLLLLRRRGVSYSVQYVQCAVPVPARRGAMRWAKSYYLPEVFKLFKPIQRMSKIDILNVIDSQICSPVSCLYRTETSEMQWRKCVAVCSTGFIFIIHSIDNNVIVAMVLELILSRQLLRC